MKSFNGYGLFYDVRNYQLRTYNRINVFLNVRDRHGVHVARNYLKKFSRKEQISILNMMKDITATGYEQYRRDIFRARNS